MEDRDAGSVTPRRSVLFGMAGLGAVAGASVTQSEASTTSDNWIDVRQFGARCDGRTDDAEAVQRAIDTALAVPLPPPVLIPGICRLDRAIRIRRPVDTTKSVLRIVGNGPGAGFRSARADPMFTGSPARDGSPGTEFLRFETIRFEGTTKDVGPVMSGDFLRITFAFCEFIAIPCLVSDRYAQEWRFIACLARGWHGPFFAAAGGYGVTSSNGKYQFGGPVFRLVDASLRKAGCVGCSFVQDIYEGSIGPFLEFELGKGVNVSNLHAEDIESPTIICGSRALSIGVSISGCFFGTRPDNVKAPAFGEIVWNMARGAVSIGNVSVGRLHRRDARAVDFVSLGDHDGAAP